jgi:hypothetical protein
MTSIQIFKLSHEAWNTNVHRQSSQLRWIMNVLRLKPLHCWCIPNLDKNKSNNKKSTLGPRRISKFITRQLRNLKSCFWRTTSDTCMMCVTGCGINTIYLKPYRHTDFLEQEFPDEHDRVKDFHMCSTCRQSVSRGKNPSLSKSNGYKYPDHPPNLPPLDPITERLTSPRLSVMQIRWLRHETGTYKIIGQIINAPVEVDNMVKQLPRQLDDDYASDVSIKKHIVTR